jgi:hypothetical protein
MFHGDNIAMFMQLHGNNTGTIGRTRASQDNDTAMNSAGSEIGKKRQWGRID